MRIANEQSVPCVVCRGNSVRVKAISGRDVGRNLARMFEDESARSLSVIDYVILRCTRCSLEFADPSIAGDDAFYGWLANRPGYYPTRRWGWDVIRAEIVSLAKTMPRRLVVLDVGCGAGAFSESLAGIPNIRNIGIDTTERSVAACKARGIEAYCCTLEEVRTVLSDDVDVLTSFHCVEHVSDPVGMLRDARSLLRPDGQIFITTPYSPMSYEVNWPDPLNYPPHHLTRWNEVSHKALAEHSRLQVTLTLGPQFGRKSRLLNALFLQSGHSPYNAMTAARRNAHIAWYSLLHPIRFAKEVHAQQTRKRIDGVVAPDEIMARLTLPSSTAAR